MAHPTNGSTQTNKASVLARVSPMIGHTFLNTDWLWAALHAPGAGVVHCDGRDLTEGHKQLAGIGDRVLSLHITVTSFQQGQTIGLTNIRMQQLNENSRLSDIADKSGLTSSLQCNPGTRTVGAKTKADLVKAVVGAAFLDNGLDAAARVMLALGILDDDE